MLRIKQTYTHHFDTPVFKKDVTVHTGLFIDNEFVDATDQTPIEVIDPATGKIITGVAGATKPDVDKAVASAQKAYDTTWGLKVPGVERAKLLHKLADLWEAHLDELAAIEAIDDGKQFLVAKSYELLNGLSTLRYYAGFADKIFGKTIETDPTKLVYTLHEPIGVVGAIIPWNYPLMIMAWKLGPALATGNCVILKPSEITPLGALKVAELVREAGFPPGVVSVLPGLGAAAGQALIDHPAVRKISFTGSVATGRRVLAASGATNLKRITLELGGKGPNVVFDDADIEQAVKWTAMGIFTHAGQMCIAGSRIFVQEGIYDVFVQHLVAVAKSMQPGSGFETDIMTKVDPVVSQSQLERILGYIRSGQQEGATVLAGGTQVGETGFFLQPTLFGDVRPEMKIVREEIFGPVGVVIKFRDEAELVAMANASDYGLAACVHTRDLERATRMARALEAGSVYINSMALPDCRVAFGGYKMSGIGKDLGEYALEGYTNVKAVHVNIGQKL
ncbi:putative aldehyde dehydrogenase [Phanerochaete sordida]|uniref:Aldehyde dehydrogenase n=1 Tax=Phanerochaete sordida TaxID=48140 RepID=A0A9P3LAK5_9APHY|nr:putative aldehyde dehydrogenase [Phanerochaete sordida]